MKYAVQVIGDAIDAVDAIMEVMRSMQVMRFAGPPALQEALRALYLEYSDILE